jgi:GLPGLI family protein
MNIKKLFILLFLSFQFSQIDAQISYGKITYERRTNLYKKFKHYENVKEWLNETDKNKIDLFELYFNDTLSYFGPKESNLVERLEWATSKNSVYQNYKSNVRQTEKSMWGEKFTVIDSIRTFKWKITDSKRNICGYQCRKAIWQANDTTRLYAWYCNEISTNVGPESFTGLPGAILGLATEDGGVVYFAKNVEIVKPELSNLIPKKSKNKHYKTAELKAQLEKEYGKEKWGKMMLYNLFAIW